MKTVYKVKVLDAISGGYLSEELEYPHAKQAMYRAFQMIKVVEEMHDGAIMWDNSAVITSINNEFCVLEGIMVGISNETFQVIVETVNVSDSSPAPYYSDNYSERACTDEQKELANSIDAFFKEIESGNTQPSFFFPLNKDHSFYNIDSENDCDCPNCNDELNEITLPKSAVSTMSVKDLQVNDCILVSDEIKNESHVFNHHITYRLLKREDEVVIYFELRQNKKFWHEIFNLENYIATLSEIIMDEDDLCFEDMELKDESNLSIEFHKHFNGSHMSEAIEEAEFTIEFLHKEVYLELIKKSKKLYNDLDNEETA